jgi:opacity protein-like surface antigen
MMKFTTLAATALFAMSLAGAPALAQTPGAGSAPGAADRTAPDVGGMDATGAIGPGTAGRMFSDTEQTQLFPDAELRANWDAFPETEQAAVRAECERIDAGGAPAGPGWIDLCTRVGAF